MAARAAPKVIASALVELRTAQSALQSHRSSKVARFDRPGATLRIGVRMMNRSVLVREASEARARIAASTSAADARDDDASSSTSEPDDAAQWDFVQQEPASKIAVNETLIDTACEQEAAERATLSLFFKLVVIGDTGVGKTTFIHALQRPRTETMFDARLLRKREATVGVDFVVLHRLLRDVSTAHRYELYTHAKLQLWDTAGQERFRSIIPSYTRDTNAVFLVFDLTNEASLHSLSSAWRETLRFARENNDQPIFALVGTKADCTRKLSASEIRSFAQDNDIQFSFECTALRRATVHRILDCITLALSKSHRNRSLTALANGDVDAAARTNRRKKGAVRLQSGSAMRKARCQLCA